MEFSRLESWSRDTDSCCVWRLWSPCHTYAMLSTCLALNKMHYSVLSWHLHYSILMSCYCCVVFDLALALVLILSTWIFVLPVRVLVLALVLNYWVLNPKPVSEYPSVESQSMSCKLPAVLWSRKLAHFKATGRLPRISSPRPGSTNGYLAALMESCRSISMRCNVACSWVMSYHAPPVCYVMCCLFASLCLHGLDVYTTSYVACNSTDAFPLQYCNNVAAFDARRGSTIYYSTKTFYNYKRKEIEN